MARPITKRKVGFFPENYHFTPDIQCVEDKKEVILSHSELESIRLADLKGLDQEASAKSMGISRGTFQRILSSARHTIAEAIVYGREIRISGGEYSLNNCYAYCKKCKHTWQAPCDVLFYDNDGKCPECGAKSIGCSDGCDNCSLGEVRHQNMLNPEARQEYHK